MFSAPSNTPLELAAFPEAEGASMGWKSEKGKGKNEAKKNLAQRRGGAEGADLLQDARAIIEAARTGAYRAVNAALVQRNWLLGKRIAEEKLDGKGRAEYGRRVIGELAGELTALYGAGFDAPSLYKFVEFYRTFPNLESLTLKSGGLLSWTHYVKLLQLKNDEARRWYLDEAGSEAWSGMKSQFVTSDAFQGNRAVLAVTSDGNKGFPGTLAAKNAKGAKNLPRRRGGTEQTVRAKSAKGAKEGAA